MAWLWGRVAGVNQPCGVQKAEGDAPFFGSLDDCLGLRWEAQAPIQLTQFFRLRRHIERLIVDGGPPEPEGGLQRRPGELLVLIFNSHFVNSFRRRLARTTESTVRASHALEFQRNMFENVGGIGAAAQTFEKTAPFADAT